MGQAWFCPVCSTALSLARFERGWCVVVPRHPDCPLSPPEAASAERTESSEPAPPTDVTP
jgi:hypothetical protein